jgi:hypothetical protein
MHTHQDHHHPPLAWRALMVEEPWWRIIPLCGLCHDEYHTLLNAYIHALAHGLDRPPDVRTYSAYLRPIVLEAWTHRPSDKPPYTLWGAA